jgi:hypothetical protein
MTVDEVEQELSRLSAGDRFHLFHVLSRGADHREERERHYEARTRGAVQAPPLHHALTALRATMAGLPLDSQSLLIEALSYDVDMAWLEEIRHQIEGFGQEELVTIDAETFLAGLRQRREVAERSIEDEGFGPGELETIDADTFLAGRCQRRDEEEPSIEEETREVSAPSAAAEARPRGSRRRRRARRR